MYQVTGIEFYDSNGGGEAFLALPGQDAASSEYLADIAIMQSTGQKDRKGTEIFEGDIVQWVPTGIRGLVSWSNEESQWKWGRFPLSYPQSRKIKVIGNVHENPELLD